MRRILGNRYEMTSIAGSGNLKAMLAWDFLFVLFVAMPLLTGGLWLEQPGLRMEYTQPGPAAIVLLLLLWRQIRKGKDPFRESRVFRFTASLWGAWARALRQHSVRLLLPLWFLVTGSWFAISLFRHNALQSGAADLGIFTNAIWNTAELGWPYSSIKGGTTFLADHQMFVLYPLGWLFRLWPSPAFLLLLQAGGLASGAIALYLLGRQRLGNGSRWLPFLPFLYWLYPAIRAANLFDFHPEIFILPLLLFGVFLLQEESTGRRLAGGALLLLTLACKESAGPVLAGLGLAWASGAGPQNTRSFTRKAGLAAILAGAAAFLFDIKLLPALLGVNYTYGSVYSDFGPGPAYLLLAPFLHPVLLLQRLLGLSRLRFYFRLLAPLAFLPLFAPLAVLAATPGLLMLALGAGEQRLLPGFHYGIEPGAGFFLALIPALSSAWVVKRERWLLLALPWLLLITVQRSDPYYWRHFNTSAHAEWLEKEFFPALNPRLSLSASSALVPHLSTRHWIHFLPILENEKGERADCVLWDHSVNNSPMGPGEEERLRLTLAKDYVPEFQCSPLTLHREKNNRAHCLQRFLDCK
jgi:uncharacterized membrane protein